MKNKSPAFQFYPKDFLSDEKVLMMTNQEVGCYIKLLCYCWLEGSIPSDVNKIAKLCGENSSVMAELWPSLKSCFKSTGNYLKRLKHCRLEKEREKQDKYHKERSESGIKGAKIRWEKGLKELSNNGSANGSANSSAITQPMAEPMANDSSSSSSSSSSSLSSSINNIRRDSSVQENLGQNLHKKKTNLSDEEFIKEIKNNPGYQGIDIDREIGKMKAWLLTPKGKKRKLTKGFMLNWLNKIDQLINYKEPDSPRNYL